MALCASLDRDPTHFAGRANSQSFLDGHRLQCHRHGRTLMQQRPLPTDQPAPTQSCFDLCSAVDLSHRAACSLRLFKGPPVVKNLRTTTINIIARPCLPPQSLLAHPLHPQLTHCIPPPPPAPSSPSSFLLKLPFGTRHTQAPPKFVSLVCTHRRQHSFSYPCFFHFAIKFASAYPFFSSQSYSCLLIASRV